MSTVLSKAQRFQRDLRRRKARTTKPQSLTKTIDQLIAECQALPPYLQAQVVEAYERLTNEEGALALAEALKKPSG